jgi:hypothetical protein
MQIKKFDWRNGWVAAGVLALVFIMGATTQFDITQIRQWASIFLKSASSDGLIYLSSNGSNSNDGLSWGSAKLTLAEAQSACPSSGACTILISPKGLTISSTFALTRAQTAIKCQPGAVLTTTVASGDVIDDSASDTKISGCNFTWSSGSGVAFSITKNASRIYFEQNTVNGYPNASGSEAVVVGNRSNSSSGNAVTDVSVNDNKFYNNAGVNVQIYDFAYRVHVEDNDFVTAISSAANPIVNAQTYDASTTMQGLIIAGNHMWNGLGNDCVQIQPLGTSSQIYDSAVAHNICILTNTVGTGYSLSGVGLTSTGNIFDADSESFNGPNPPFEIINCQHCASSADVARMGSQSTSGVIFSGGINTGTSQNNIWSNDVVHITATGTSTWACFYAVAATPGVINGLTITGINCDMSASTTSGILRGIWIQCDNSGATCTNGQISGTFLGTSTNGSNVAMAVEYDAGTLSGWNLSDNSTVAGFSYRASGNLNTQVRGQIQLSTGSGTYKFGGGSGVITMDAAPICTGNDISTADPFAIVSSTTGVTITGNGSDHIAFSCGPAEN